MLIDQFVQLRLRLVMDDDVSLREPNVRPFRMFKIINFDNFLARAQLFSKNNSVLSRCGRLPRIGESTLASILI